MSANGQMPAGIAHAGEAAPPLRSGLTIAGQLPHYTPVTDAMLTHPPDGDWLMFRAQLSRAGATARSSRSTPAM